MKIILKCYRICLNYVYEYKSRMILALLFRIVKMVCSLVFVYVSAKLLSSVIEIVQLRQFIFWAVLFVGIAVINYIVSSYSDWLEIRVKKDINIHCKCIFLSKLFNSLDGRIRDASKTFNIIYDDTKKISEFIIFVNNLILQVNATLFLIIIMIKINWCMAIVFFFSTPIVFVINSTIGKKVRSYRVVMADYTDRFIEFFKYMVDNSEDIIINGHSSLFIDKSRDYMDEIKTVDLKAEKKRLESTILSNVARDVNTLLVMILGAICIYRKVLSVEQFIVFCAFGNTIRNTLSLVVNINVSAQQMIVGIQRVDQLYRDLFESEKRTIVSDKINVEVNDMTIGYGENVLKKGISVQFLGGNVYSIKGKNGVGKTTFLKTLCGIKNSIQGEVLVKARSSKLIKDTFMYSSQEPIVYPGLSIKENMLMDSSDEDEMKELARWFDLERDICELENGYDTVVSSSLKLSGGQKKKIQLIRALLVNREIMIFDEPTAFLDEVNRKRFYIILDKSREGRLVIIASHDEESCYTNAIHFSFD